MVVAIIAILAAMLLPALSRAREKARQALCIANLKQLVLADLMYATDYDGYLVPMDSNVTANKETTAGDWSSNNFLARYGIAANSRAKYCPSDKNRSVYLVSGPISPGARYMQAAYNAFPPKSIQRLKEPAKVICFFDNRNQHYPGSPGYKQEGRSLGNWVNAVYLDGHTGIHICRASPDYPYSTDIWYYWYNQAKMTHEP